MRTFELIDRHTGEVTFSGVPVTRTRPCDICGHPQHKREGWCLRDAARGLTICGHVRSPRQVGDAGWLHGKVNSESLSRASFSVQKPRPQFDASVVGPLLRALKPQTLLTHADVLGVKASALMDLDIGWSEEHGAYSFPMRDAARRIVGVRLRKPDGFKFAIENSRNGLFYPELRFDGPIFLPEGPTDSAALRSLGFDVIGRPFCRGGIDALCDVFSRLPVKRPAVVVADQDKVGIEGAEATADALFGIVPVKVIKPPPTMKDARDWLKGGATHDLVMFRVDQTPFWNAQREELVV